MHVPSSCLFLLASPCNFQVSSVPSSVILLPPPLVNIIVILTASMSSSATRPHKSCVSWAPHVVIILPSAWIFPASFSGKTKRQPCKHFPLSIRLTVCLAHSKYQNTKSRSFLSISETPRGEQMDMYFIPGFFDKTEGKSVYPEKQEATSCTH